VNRRLVVTALLLSALVAAPFAQQQATPPAQAAPTADAAKVDAKAAASYAGKWNMDVQSPQGAMQIGLEVVIDKANVVTGTLNGPQGPTPLKGEFKEGTLGFTISFDAGGQMIEIYFEGTINPEGKLAGQMHLGDMGSFPWTATRVKGL
jgi:hypothetical protein